MEGERTRSIKLLCPSVSSKTFQILASEEQKLDLGSISRAFGLDPNTLKLNGHFISRGIDLIASSVTWKSLTGFFSSRGLSTGASDSDPLLVDGRLSKIGSKRPHDPTEIGVRVMNELECIRNNKKPHFDNRSWLSGGRSNTSSTTTVHNVLCSPDLKRKLWSEDQKHSKRLRSDKPISGLAGRSYFNLPSTTFSCSFISKRLKRMRVDEMVVAAPLKKTR